MTLIESNNKSKPSLEVNMISASNIDEQKSASILSRLNTLVNMSSSSSINSSSLCSDQQQQQQQHNPNDTASIIQDYYKNSPLRHYHNHYRPNLTNGIVTTTTNTNTNCNLITSSNNNNNNTNSSISSITNNNQSELNQHQNQESHNESPQKSNANNSKKRRPQSVTSEEEDEDDDDDDEDLADADDDSECDELVIDTNNTNDNNNNNNNNSGDCEADDEINDNEDDSTSEMSMCSFEANTYCDDDIEEDESIENEILLNRKSLSKSRNRREQNAAYDKRSSKRARVSNEYEKDAAIFSMNTNINVNQRVSFFYKDIFFCQKLKILFFFIKKSLPMTNSHRVIILIMC